MVEERSAQGEAKRVSRGGQGGSENVRLSNENTSENLVPENVRVPLQGSSSEGQSGPKVRPKGVIDGKKAYIPSLLLY